MMLARKWDRIENLVKKHGYDIFNAIDADPSNNGPIDDIRDLRRYLLLVEAEMTVRGAFTPKQQSYGILGQPPLGHPIPGSTADVPVVPRFSVSEDK